MEAEDFAKNQNLWMESSTWGCSLLGMQYLQIDIYQCWRMSSFLVRCEDIKHMMFLCEKSKEVWMQLGLWSKIENIMRVDRSGSISLEKVIRWGIS
jgi:hypothetical protein